MFPVYERKRTKYVGRSEEFRRISELLAEVSAGHGKLVMVEGEAGIGKTRFTEEIRALPEFKEFSFLKGRCLYFKDTDVYLPFKEMFNQYWELKNKGKGEEPRSPFVTDEGGQGTDEQVLIKEEEFLPMSLIPAEAEIEQREEMPVEGLMRYDKLSQFIFNMASESPVCLLIDDLHWADPPSLQMLYYLAQRIRDHRIFIICTYRPEDLFWGGDNSHPLAESIKRFNRDHLYVPVKLNRLSKVEAEEIMGSLLQVDELPQSFSELIYGRTLGNPFFIEEVLYSLIERGIIDTSSIESLKNLDMNSISLPSNLKDVIQRRVHWLKPVSIKVVRFASVSGESFDFDIIKEALELKDEDIIEALEELTAAKFVVEAKVEERYEFENPVIQEVIYSELNQSRRRFLHTRMAKVLEDRFSSDPSQWANIAMHYYKGKDFERALNYLTKAASYYQNLAPQRALEYLHMVLDCIQRLPQSDAIKAQNMGVLVDISDLCLQVGDLRRSMEFAEKALNLASILKDTKAITRSKLNIAEIFRQRGDFDTSMRYYEDAIKLSQQNDNYDGMANAFMGMGYIKWRRGDFPKSLEMFSKSLQYAKIDNSLRTIGKLYLCIGDLFQQRGDMDKSVDYYIRGIKHLETIGDSLTVSQGHSSIARVNMDRGDLDEAEVNLRQALEKAKEKGRPDFKPPHIQLLKLRSMQGRFEDARLAFETLMDSLNSEEEKVFFALANMNYGECCSIEGRRAESESLLMKALDTFTALDMPYELGRTKVILADHYARNDDRSIARDLLLEAQGIFKSIGAKAQFDATVGRLASLGR